MLACLHQCTSFTVTMQQSMLLCMCGSISCTEEEHLKAGPVQSADSLSLDRYSRGSAGRPAPVHEPAALPGVRQR